MFSASPDGSFLTVQCAVADPALAVLVRYSLSGVVQPPFSTTAQVMDSSIQKTCTCPAFELKAPSRLTDLFIGISIPVGSNREWYVQSPTLAAVAGAQAGTACTCS